MRFVFVALTMLASSAFAADAPTVTLTQDQLQRKIDAVARIASARAVADYIAQEQTTTVKDVDAALQKAFTPKPADEKK